MPGGSRRGFKYVKAADPVTTETISFDDVENENTTTPIPKKKRQAKSTAIMAAVPKSRKTAASSSSGSSARSQNQEATSSSDKDKKYNGKGSSNSNKAHYPNIDFDLNKITMKKQGGKYKTHAELLDKIVVEACNAEKVGLDYFFKQNEGKGREAIHAVLREVLEELPGRVTSACPEDVQFKPEFVSGEKHEVFVLQQMLETLREQGKALEIYEKDIGLMAVEHGIWLNGPTESAIQSAAAANATASSPGRKRGGATSGSGIKGLSASSADFESTLQGMEDACDSLLSDVAKTVEVGARAKTMQDKLYAGYNKARFESKGGVALPGTKKSTKDLIRGFAKQQE